MSLKLNVGVSKKVGLPDYGSLASCSLEVDLASTLLNDPESLRVALARVYAICRVAVSKELAVQKAAPGGSLGPQDCREGHPVLPPLSGPTESVLARGAAVRR